MKKLLTAPKVWGIVLRIVIMLVIPYAYLMLCGLVFDRWLYMYQMTKFIFWSLMALWAVAVVLSVLCIIWSVKARKGNK